MNRGSLFIFLKIKKARGYLVCRLKTNKIKYSSTKHLIKFWNSLSQSFVDVLIYAGSKRDYTNQMRARYHSISYNDILLAALTGEDLKLLIGGDD